jgi:hypothetical protein
LSKALFGVATVLVVGCSAPIVASYSVGLQTVERDAKAQEQFGVANAAEVNEGDSVAFVLEDGLMRITWVVEEARLPFVLENKTDQPIRIIWNDAIFMDLNGAPHKVMHRDVRYSQRGEPQAPTTVKPGETREDYILAINLPYQESDASWREDPFLKPYRRMSRAELEPALLNVGRSFVAILPLEFQGEVHEYVFTFRVRDVQLP